MHEILFAAAGMRAPIVMADANRAISAPLNIWNDQQDSIAQRDAGWIQLYVENAQEGFDTILQEKMLKKDSILFFKHTELQSMKKLCYQLWYV